jgi:hypothetical protein
MLGRRRRGKRWTALALCAGGLLLGSQPLAAPKAAPDAPAIASVQPDRECEALLLKVERQIADGHTAAPPDDNALQTWQSVVLKLQPPSPPTLRALADFVGRVYHQEAAERAAGRAAVELDLRLFEDLANELLALGTAALNAHQAAAKPVSESATPEAPAVEGTADTARAPTAVMAPQDQADAAALVRRGDAVLAIMDISAARKFYERAANAGSAAAAMALARTFDPEYLAGLGVVGLRPDPALAARWYRKAAALGNRDAEARVRSLERSVN